MLEKMKDLFTKPQRSVYILIREGAFGVETYVNQLIIQFNPAYRSQVIEFLKGVIALLEEKKRK